MVSANELQNLYNDIYVQMRMYIWDFGTIELLADFEIAVYQRFPDISAVVKAFDKLRSEVSSTDIYREDKELKGAFEAFDEFIEDVDEIYYGLVTFKEVVDV